ncbi:MAG TPA: Hsp70 family protein [Anaerolineales bacterium]
MDEIYGLDFGTSNSSIAVQQHGYVRALPVDPSAANPAVVSSVLFIDQAGGSFIGSEAVRLFVEKNTGRKIVRKRVSSGKLIDTVFGTEMVQFEADVDLPGRFFQAIKSSLANELFEGTDVFGSFRTIEELTAGILRQLKTRADGILGKDVEAVVMGRPVHFSDDPKQDALAQARLEQAARLAGFKDIRFLYEPIGAALAYEEELRREETAFVFDFGGGTLDFSAIRLGPERIRRPDRLQDILAVGGLALGGNTFDEEIMESQLMKYFGADYSGATMTGVAIHLPYWIQAQLRSWYTIPLLNERDTLRFINELKHAATRGKGSLQALLTLVEKNYGWSLFEEIERAKIALSSEHQADITFHREDIEIDEFLTRRRFESIIAGHLHSISEGIDETLQLAGLAPGDVDVVIRTGGSSLIPAVQGLLETKFGADKVNRQDVFTSVVKGLALAGASKFN